MYTSFAMTRTSQGRTVIDNIIKCTIIVCKYNNWRLVGIESLLNKVREIIMIYDILT